MHMESSEWMQHKRWSEATAQWVVAWVRVAWVVELSVVLLYGARQSQQWLSILPGEPVMLPFHPSAPVAYGESFD